MIISPSLIDVRLNRIALMIQATPMPSIQAPAPEVLAGLAARWKLTNPNGFVFHWDRERLVFITAVMQGGEVVSWAIDPARSEAEAEALRDRSRRSLQMASAVIGTIMGPEFVEVFKQRLQEWSAKVVH
jgi:hypothetical protein